MTNLRSINNKFDQLICQSFVSNVDVIICTETWLNNNYPAEAFNIQGFSCFRGDRDNGARGGGVAVWSKSHLRPVICPFPANSNFEICCVRLATISLIVIGIYLPPGILRHDVDAIHDKLIETLDFFLESMPLHRFIIAGDFNRYDMSPLTSQFSLTNIVSRPTRNDANLDLIFVDERLLSRYSPERIEVGPPIGGSDHRCVIARSCDAVERRQTKMHVLYDMRLSHILNFEQAFLENDMYSFYHEEDLEVKCQIFYRFINNALTVIPQSVVTTTSSDAPWMTPLIKHLIDDRWKAYRAQDWARFNHLKAKVKRAISRAKLTFFSKKRVTVKGLWSFVNAERGRSGNDISSLFENDSCPEDVLNKLNDKYCSYMNSRHYGIDRRAVEDDGWFPSFYAYDIWRLLSNLSSKSTGSDGVPALLYKKCALVFAEPICHLICESIRQRRFPSLWKVADIIPIPKSSAISIENTRPISLLPVPAKIAEKVVLIDMKDRLTSLLGVHQFAIRKNSSTTHAIIAVHDALTERADDKSFGSVIYISFDFSKAFDKVEHSVLLSKIDETDLPGGFKVLMDNYLQDRFQQVRYEMYKSRSMRVTSGVPQGSLLGPYLFGLYIASLRPAHRSTCMVKYMDDVSIVGGIRKSCISHDLSLIQSEIDNISSWSNTNFLALNTSKTVALVRYRGQFRSICDVESLLTAVQFKPCVRFLGVHLDADLRWSSHTNFIAKKCAQRLYVLRRMKLFASSEECFQIYSALIRSLMEYASPAFVGISASNSRRLAQVERRCLKLIGNDGAGDLVSRRVSASLRLYTDLPNQKTFVKSLPPLPLRSGRPAVVHCNSSLRRSSFIPHMSVLASATYCD